MKVSAQKYRGGEVFTPGIGYLGKFLFLGQQENR
jgi:hypothetical protein